MYQFRSQYRIGLPRDMQGQKKRADTTGHKSLVLMKTESECERIYH